MSLKFENNIQKKKKKKKDRPLEFPSKKRIIDYESQVWKQEENQESRN